MCQPCQVATVVRQLSRFVTAIQVARIPPTRCVTLEIEISQSIQEKCQIPIRSSGGAARSQWVTMRVSVVVVLCGCQQVVTLPVVSSGPGPDTETERVESGLGVVRSDPARLQCLGESDHDSSAQLARRPCPRRG